MSNMSNKKLSEKERNKYIEKLKKIEDKIERVNKLLFKTDQYGDLEMIMNSSTKYLLSKLKPLFKEQENLNNKINPDTKSDINYLENQDQNQSDIDNYLN